jgi:lipoic acid synthetase
MGGFGETIHEVHVVIYDLRQSGCDMLTIGQSLAPSDSHLPVERYYTPEEFGSLRVYGEEIGFNDMASGPLVRSSCHADVQSGLL